MATREAKCPECGGQLSVTVELDKQKQIIIQLFCEGDEEDKFWFEIATGMTNSKLARLRSNAPQPMQGRLIERYK
jgi:hypothetical protein